MFHMRRLCSIFLSVLFLSVFTGSWGRAANVVTTDVCVYGGTSGGAIAAVAAARLGKKVALVMVNNHVGGMTSGGLGVTDVGNAASIGGFAAEFYSRVGHAYGTNIPVYWFEPHVAEQTFLQMLSEAGVAIYPNQLLAAVTESNRVISQITMADGTVYRAKEFIDTTYEGDLMAMAGVTFTFGRESSAAYGESLAGVQVNSVDYACDPYVIPGDAASGLLPLIQAGNPGTPGAGDTRIQNYNFRLCLTQNVTNQIPITAPTNYSEATYELLHRYINAYVAANGSVPLNRLIDVQQLIPNGKTDINAYAPISTDFIGYNYTYPTNTYTARQLIYQQHQDYIAGLLYYLANSTNVPVNVRTNMQSWGYAKDEFQDNGGWPYPLYIREARRMVSDYVMLQQDALGERAATDSIALASYTLDCHPDARFAVNGVATTEGGIGVTVQYPYPVSYRSIVPSVGQCQNLFCTFALSASHVGFSSVRLEPVFMMTSQSAGTAAAFAIDDQVSVQQVNYQKLAAQLIADGQMLTWSSGQSVSTNGIILTVNNTTGVTASGGWTTGANPGGWPLPNGTYWHDGNTGKGTKYVTFTPTLTTNGYYDVYLWWVADSNRATNVPVNIANGIASSHLSVNQQINGSTWVKIVSSNYFNAGTGCSVTVSNAGTTGYVIANAVRWMPLGTIAPVSPTPTPVVEIVASDAMAGEFQTNAARFAIVCPNGTNAGPLTVNYSISGTAVAGTDYAALPGAVTIAAGAVATNIIISPLGNYLTTSQVSVTLGLMASANYAFTSLTNATVTILDYPLNDWLRANFTPVELADPDFSGDNADPINDGLPVLMDYALGLSPTTANPNPFVPALTNGIFAVAYPRSDAAADVTLVPEWSTNLLTWVSGTNYIQQTIEMDDGTNQTILIRPLVPSTAGYFRFRVSRQ
jgi:hypothetical protein